MTLSETLLVIPSVDSGTLERVGQLDLRSPFDELGELRKLLTTQEIAELTGLRRETISRARRDSRFRRSTEKSLADLHAVVTSMKAVAGGGHAHLAAVLRRPQKQFDGRSIAELLKEGKVELKRRTAPEAELVSIWNLDAIGSTRDRSVLNKVLGRLIYLPPYSFLGLDHSR